MTRWKHKLIWIILPILITGACTTVNNSEELFANASTTSEVIEMIKDTLTINQTSASEIVIYIQNNELDCVDQEDAIYDPNFSEQEYDSWIVCWESAPNADTPSSNNIINIVNVSVSSWIFRIVFLIKEDFLVEVKVILDDRSP